MPLSGREMLRLYFRAGWRFIRQRGSHVSVVKNGQHATIPMHRELSKGVEHQLLKRLRESEKKP